MTRAPIALPSSTAARPTPLGCAEHEKALARPDLRAVFQRVMRGAVGHQEGRRGDEIHFVGDRRYPRFVERDFLGKAAPAAGADDAVADLHPGDALANLDDLAGDLAARREGQRRLELIFVFDDQHVGEIDGRRMDLEQHLALAGFGRRHLLDDEAFGRAVFLAQNGFHGRLPLILL